jgi:hypothetical protein
MPKLPVRGAGIAPPALTDVLTSAAGYAADEKSAATSSLSDLMGGTKAMLPFGSSRLRQC